MLQDEVQDWHGRTFKTRLEGGFRLECTGSPVISKKDEFERLAKMREEVELP